MARVYRVLGNLQHDGVEYAAGQRSIIAMTDEQEAVLVSAGVVAVELEQVAPKRRKGAVIPAEAGIQPDVDDQEPA